MEMGGLMQKQRAKIEERRTGNYCRSFGKKNRGLRRGNESAIRGGNCGMGVVAAVGNRHRSRELKMQRT